nr:MAG TPA_asm: hypothetical protein [Caudoviricetes sp.]
MLCCVLRSYKYIITLICEFVNSCDNIFALICVENSVQNVKKHLDFKSWM